MHCIKEMSMGLGFDWIRTITISVEFGLDPDGKLFQKFRIRTRFGMK